MSKNIKSVPDHPDTGQPNTPEPYDTPMWRAVKKGIVWGALVGFAIAQFIMRSQTIDSPVGSFYPGNVLLMYGVCVGLGAAMCAGIGYLATRDTDDAAGSPPIGPKGPVD